MNHTSGKKSFTSLRFFEFCCAANEQKKKNSFKRKEGEKKRALYSCFTASTSVEFSSRGQDVDPHFPNAYEFECTYKFKSCHLTFLYSLTFSLSPLTGSKLLFIFISILLKYSLRGKKFTSCVEYINTT